MMDIASRSGARFSRMNAAHSSAVTSLRTAGAANARAEGRAFGALKALRL